MSELTTENIDEIAAILNERVSEIEDKGNLDDGSLKQHYFSDVFDSLVKIKQEIRLRDEFPIEEGTITKTEHGVMIKWFPDAPQSEKERIKDLLHEMNWVYNRTSKNAQGEDLDQEFYFCQPPKTE